MFAHCLGSGGFRMDILVSACSYNRMVSSCSTVKIFWVLVIFLKVIDSQKFHQTWGVCCHAVITAESYSVAVIHRKLSTVYGPKVMSGILLIFTNSSINFLIHLLRQRDLFIIGICSSILKKCNSFPNNFFTYFFWSTYSAKFSVNFCCLSFFFCKTL